MIKYSDSGVNIELGDDTSKVFYNAAKLTWKNRKGKIGEVIVPFDEFRSVRGIDVSNLPEGTIMGLELDGIGTKIELCERTGDYSTAAWDTLAMNTEDASAKGAEPLVFGSILDVRSLGENGKTYKDQIDQLAMGSIAAAEDAGIAIINGETAELGDRVGGYGSKGFIDNLAHEYILLNLNENNWESIKSLSGYLREEEKEKKKDFFEKMMQPEKDFVTKVEKTKTLNCNWGGAVVWIAQKDRILTGSKIKPGYLLVALEEESFRANGLSLVRKILRNKYGNNWHEVEYLGETLGRQVLKPSKIYTKAIVEMTGGYDREPGADVHGVAHITGGGIPSKLGGVLKPNKLGAYIDRSFEPTDLMLHCQEIGNVSDEEAYRTWNMGHGMIVVTSFPQDVKNIAQKYNINSKVIGTVSDKPGIKIKSRGYHSHGDFISF